MFKLIKKSKSGVRIGELITAHGKIETPFFMPVATRGSVRGISPDELDQIGAQIILCNTYHLYLRPGEKIINKLGGLHKFSGWDKPILTDSGGYQVFSLGEKTAQKSKESLVKITEEGVEFKSHLDGSKHLLTPEKVIQIQLDLGVDILMPLDVCPSGKATKDEIKNACDITLRWAKRSKEYFDIQKGEIEPKKRPLLHGIVQGGLYEDLRRGHASEMIKLDFDGYSVGGLAVDYETRDMWKTVKLMGEILPENKQRYLMGVGTPDDIIRATKLGMDMFDCVLPTRLARHGSVYIENKSRYKLTNLLNSRYREDGRTIENNCGCYACKNGYSKAYIGHLIRSGEMFGLRLATLHNLYKYIDLLKKIRN